MKINVKTWWFEALVVWNVLLLALIIFGKVHDWREWLAALGVGLGFHHASVASRLQEAEEARPKSRASVDCVKWLNGYWVGKELAWVLYFLATGAVSALVGCAVFLAHPFWRKWYRTRHPREVEPAQIQSMLDRDCDNCQQEHAKAEAAYARGLAVHAEEAEAARQAVSELELRLIDLGYCTRAEHKLDEHELGRKHQFCGAGTPIQSPNDTAPWWTAYAKPEELGQLPTGCLASDEPIFECRQGYGCGAQYKDVTVYRAHERACTYRQCCEGGELTKECTGCPRRVT